MRLKFLAGAGKPSYSIQGDLIEGIDTSLFIEGSDFLGNEETRSVGIFDMFWQDGELHVTLAQPTKTSDIPWAARDNGWIDAADYDPTARYVKATNPQAVALLEIGQAEYFKDADGKWSVRMIEIEEQEPAA